MNRHEQQLDEASEPLEETLPATRILLDEVDLPPRTATVSLASGRRYEIATDDGADHLIVTSSSGAVVLSVQITDEGPVLAFASAHVRLSATGTLRLDAREVHVRSTGDLRVEAGGSVRERISGDRHATVGGCERVEAHSVELQASAGHVAVRAMHRIGLDGEHIGLNDDPLPRPFAWSSIAAENEEG